MGTKEDAVLKTLVKIVFVFFSLTALASASEWEEWGSGAEGSTWHILKTGAKKSGKYAEVWFLVDLPNKAYLRDGAAYQSAKFLYLFDCDARRSGKRVTMLFSDRMGRGREILSSDRGNDYARVDWITHAPDDWTSKGYDKFCKSIWEFWK